jgi:hypothetical protein
MAFSPDSSLLATCHNLEEILLVHVPDLAPVARLTIPFGAKITSLDFSADGAKVAALEEAGAVHLWNLREICGELKNLHLAWELPRFPAPVETGPTNSLACKFDGGPFSRVALADAVSTRDSNTPVNLIDLTEYYNAPLVTNWYSGQQLHDSWSRLPRGVQTLSGISFDVRGLIQIEGEDLNVSGYPNQVSNIRIGAGCRRLHFLHGVLAAEDRRFGETLGSYIVHYVDGRRVSIPIILGKDVADASSQMTEHSPRPTMAWAGTDSAAESWRGAIRLFKTTWENPYPTVPVRQFDFVSAQAGAPFLVAVTADPQPE